MTSDEFLTSDQGRRILYVTRLMRRIRLRIDLEPRSKNAMPLTDKVTLQRSILDGMTSRRRRAFRGPLALDIRATTTEKTPSHAQTLAKNLLDLLGSPLPEVAVQQRGILYFDDRQVRALSVSVEHGAAAPGIEITAARYADFLDDISLACHAEQRVRSFRYEGLGDWGLGGLSFSRFNEDSLRKAVGNEATDAFLASLESFRRTERYMSQMGLLSRSPFGFTELAVLLGAPLFGRRGVSEAGDRLFRRIEESVRSHPLRISLPALPQRHGDSRTYREMIWERLEEFQNRFGAILKPLLHPVAMEVIVKPPPTSHPRPVTDLDNVARNHLIPAIAAYLQPPLHNMWAVDRHGMVEARDEAKRHRTALLKGTLIGLTRYSVFVQVRPPGDESGGAVTLSLVAADGGFGEIFTRIDTIVDDWEGTL